MISLHQQVFLKYVLLLEGALLVFALAVLLSRVLWLWWQELHWRQLRHAARAAVNDALVQDRVSDLTRRALAQLPQREQHRLLWETGRFLTGALRTRLATLARQSGLREFGVRLCNSPQWWRRLKGLRLLTLLGPIPSDLIRQLSGDRSDLVRAQVADSITIWPDPALTPFLFQMLSDPSRLCRIAAQEALYRQSNQIAKSLENFLQTETGPAADAALAVAITMPSAELYDVAQRLSLASESQTRTLAIRLLASMGDRRSTARLIELLTDSAENVRSAGAQALGSLGHWRAAPQVAQLLRDPRWTVRQEAGRALLAFGAPGVLLLRHALHDQDAFAADMAKHLLSLPTTAMASRVVLG